MRRVLWILGIGSLIGSVFGWLDTHFVHVLGCGVLALLVIGIAFAVRWIDRGAFRSDEPEFRLAEGRAWRTWTWALAVLAAILVSSRLLDWRFEQRRAHIVAQAIPYLDALVSSGRGLPTTSRLEWNAETDQVLDACRASYVRESDTAYELSITHPGTEDTWVYRNATRTWICIPNGIP